MNFKIYIQSIPPAIVWTGKQREEGNIKNLILHSRTKKFLAKIRRIFHVRTFSVRQIWKNSGHDQNKQVFKHI